MCNKGRKIYTPPNVLDELEAIRQEDNIEKRADAFKEMAKYSRVGREAKKILTLRF